MEVLKEDNFSSTKAKGEYFGEFIIYILKATNIFRCVKNIRTSTNEIDIRAEFTVPAQDIANYYHFDKRLTLFLECKNYPHKNVDVTYIGKFYSLLSTSNKEFGIIVSPNGLTGSSWSDGHGFCKKIAIKHNVKMLSLTYQDLLNLNEKSLFTILKEKIIELEENFEIDKYIDKYIDKHPLEGQL